MTRKEINKLATYRRLREMGRGALMNELNRLTGKADHGGLSLREAGMFDFLTAQVKAMDAPSHHGHEPVLGEVRA